MSHPAGHPHIDPDDRMLANDIADAITRHRGVTPLSRRYQAAAAAIAELDDDGIRRVSSEGVDNPVASVTLHGVGEPAAWAPGDRYVWTSTPVDPQVHARVFPGSAGPGPRLKLRGVVVADPGAGQMLTVQHDGETDTALVYRDQLTPETDRG